MAEMEITFEPLKNDLLLRAARGASTSTGRTCSRLPPPGDAVEGIGLNCPSPSVPS